MLLHPFFFCRVCLCSMVYVGVVNLGLPRFTHCNVFVVLLNEKCALHGLKKKMITLDGIDYNSLLLQRIYSHFQCAQSTFLHSDFWWFCKAILLNDGAHSMPQRCCFFTDSMPQRCYFTDSILFQKWQAIRKLDVMATARGRTGPTNTALNLL